MSASNTEIRQYYQRVYLYASEYGYWVNRKGGDYLGTTKTLEEALYYRDLYSESSQEKIPKPNELNLKKNNPYIEEGLKYPIPERLQCTGKYKPYTPKGAIYKRTKSCYALYHSNKYICCCRTYEQSYYTLQKLRENNWDTSKLPEIQKHYPEWYTWLLGFYRYITLDNNYKRSNTKKQYLISIPKKYLKQGKNIELIRGYRKLEDALFERDFLAAHDWDYELLVETINDEDNPYYNMELPPYPERKIRNIRKRDPHTSEIKELQKIILNNPDISQKETSRILQTSDANIRNWLKNYNIDWVDFKTLILSGEDPLETLTLEPLIYKPDLTPAKPSTFKGYVQKNYKSKKQPWIIEYHHKTYGTYPDRDLALKIVEDLIACQWDKTQLKNIQLKHGYKPVRGSKNLIYENKTGYEIRKYINGKTTYFGGYTNHRLAEIARGLLNEYGWDKTQLKNIREEAESLYNLENQYYNNMFKGIRL